MTDSSGSESWLQEQLQRWQEIAQQLPLQPEQWQVLFDSIQAGPITDFSDQQAKLLDLVKRQSEQFSHLAKSLLETLSVNGSTDQLVEQLQHHMQYQCKDILSRQWHLPEPLASLFKESILNSESVSQAPLRELLEQLAKKPAIGTDPYNPLQVRALAQAMLDYQDSLHNYLQQYEQIFQQTGEDLKQRLDQPTTDIDSIKALHNLWIECYEKAYRETVFTEQYQACHGHLSNSLNKIRKLTFSSRDKQLKEFGLVTREEFDSAIRQQHQLRKQLRQQQQQIDELQALMLSLKPRSTTKRSQQGSIR